MHCTALLVPWLIQSHYLQPGNGAMDPYERRPAEAETLAGTYQKSVQHSFQASLEAIANGLLQGGDEQKKAALFLLQLLREGGAIIAVEASRCKTLLNALKLHLASNSDVQQQEDAALMLLELSIHPAGAAELFGARIHLVASSLSWQHESSRSVSWTAKTLCALAAANIDRGLSGAGALNPSRAPPPHLFPHMAALLESCIEAYWITFSVAAQASEAELLLPIPALDAAAEHTPKSATSVLPAMLASLSSLTRSTAEAHRVLHTSIPACVLALLREHTATRAPLSAPIIISQAREWVANKEWQNAGFPPPVFEEECGSVLDLSLALLLLLAEAPSSHEHEGGREQLLSRHHATAMLPSLAPLALGRELIPPRTQRLSERLLFRLSESPPAPAAAPPQVPSGHPGMRAADMRTSDVPATILGAWAALNNPLNQQRHHQQSLVRSLVPAIPATPAHPLLSPPLPPPGGEWRSPQVLLELAQGTAARAESAASTMEVERDAAHQELVRVRVCM